MSSRAQARRPDALVSARGGADSMAGVDPDADGAHPVVGSFINPNPGGMAAAGGGGTEPRGILKITRHPSFVAFSLFGIAHILMNGWAGDVIFFGAFSGARNHRRYASGPAQDSRARRALSRVQCEDVVHAVRGARQRSRPMDQRRHAMGRYRRRRDADGRNRRAASDALRRESARVNAKSLY